MAMSYLPPLVSVRCTQRKYIGISLNRRISFVFIGCKFSTIAGCFLRFQYVPRARNWMFRLGNWRESSPHIVLRTVRFSSWESKTTIGVLCLATGSHALYGSMICSGARDTCIPDIHFKPMFGFRIVLVAIQYPKLEHNGDGIQISELSVISFSKICGTYNRQ